METTRLRPATCPECGQPALGTLERVDAVAQIEGFDAEGDPVYVGETEIDWDTQVNQTDADGNLLVICPSLHIWSFRA